MSQPSHAQLLKAYLDQVCEGLEQPKPTFRPWRDFAAQAAAGTLAVGLVLGTTGCGESAKTDNPPAKQGGTAGVPGNAGLSGTTGLAGVTGGVLYGMPLVGGTTNQAGTGNLPIAGAGVKYGMPLLESNCNDGLDNDGDGKIDCADSDCKTNPSCQAMPAYGMPMYEYSCVDGLDNDGDGKIDCADSDCAGNSACGSGGAGNAAGTAGASGVRYGMPL